MGDTNYVSAVVKILETPKQNQVGKNSFFINFRAQIPQVRQTQIINIVCWSNLAYDILDYYKVNDYILIEGYLSLYQKSKPKMNTKILEKVQITVLKVYPFLLSSK